MYAIRLMLEKVGVELRIEGNNIRVPKDQELRVRYDVGAAVPRSTMVPGRCSPPISCRS